MVDTITRVSKRNEHPPVPWRRDAHPLVEEKPRALRSERCIVVALDPSTGDYRLTIT